jgi:hypothetical protein
VRVERLRGCVCGWIGDWVNRRTVAGPHCWLPLVREVAVNPQSGECFVSGALSGSCILYVYGEKWLYDVAYFVRHQFHLHYGRQVSYHYIYWDRFLTICTIVLGNTRQETWPMANAMQCMLETESKYLNRKTKLVSGLKRQRCHARKFITAYTDIPCHP